MTEHRIEARMIGSMPMTAEMAIACARDARRLRHVARCNCGTGKQGPNCTTIRTGPLRPTEFSLMRSWRIARERLNAYRQNRTWVYGGERHTYDHTPTDEPRVQN